MYKSILSSKTLWGFSIAGLIALSQTLGISYSEAMVVEMAKILTALFGVYGMRDAMD